MRVRRLLNDFFFIIIVPLQLFLLCASRRAEADVNIMNAFDLTA